MPAQILQIGRHRFVCGLFWQSLARRRELRKEALELAGKLSFDLLLVHVERDHAEAGFANTDDGVQPGMLSLAMMVFSAIARQGAMYDGRQQQAPNWIGALKVPDGRWAYFAVRDNRLLPNGDWVGTREEVFERLVADYGLGGWNVVIGDAELEGLGFHNFYPRTLDQLMPRRNGRLRIMRWWALRRAKRGARNIVVAAVAVALACGAAFAFLKYRGYEREQDYRRVVASQRRIALAQPPHAAAIAHPWARMPLPSRFVDTCLAHFGHLTPGGWQLSQYACSPAQASYVWTRNGSIISFLRDSVPQAQIDASGERAVLTTPLAAAAAGDEALIPEMQLRERLLSAFQPLSISLKLVVLRPEQSTTDRVTAQLPGHAPQPDWRMWRLSANLGGLSPLSVASLLDEPGVRLDEVSYRDGTWSIEGVVYAN